MKEQIKQFLTLTIYILTILFYMQFYITVKEYSNNFIAGAIAMLPLIIIIDDYVMLKYFKN